MSNSLIGCHALVWTGTFDPDGIRLSVSRTKQAGFDLVEFPLMDPFTFDTAVAKAALAQHGMAASASLGLSPSTDVSSEDPAIVAAGEKLLLRALEVVAELGGTQLCGVIYSAMKKYMDPLTEQGLANSIDTIGKVADRAAELGLSIALEVVNRYETNILNTGRQALAYVEKVGRSNVAVHLDSYHMNIEESDMYAPVWIAPTSWATCTSARATAATSEPGASTSTLTSKPWGASGIRADRVRVVLVGRRRAGSEPHARHLAEPLAGQRRAGIQRQ